MTTATRNKDLHFGRLAATPKLPKAAPDFSDEAGFRAGAVIRSRLNAALEPTIIDDLEMQEREHALKYWGY